MRYWVLGSSAAVLAALPAAASTAQIPPGDNAPHVSPTHARTQIYPADFFAPFAPTTALDIVRQVPGFVLDLGNTDIRGFAGAAGNVVINGARPSSKSDSIETQLSRIPAGRVVRVEVASGDLYGTDYAGKAQVANVILSADAGMDGNVTGKIRRLYTGRIVPDLSASAMIKRGNSSFNLSAGTGRTDYIEEGTDTAVFLPSGDFKEFRRKVNDIRPHDPYVSVNWALEPAANESVRLNARFAPSKFDLIQSNHVTTFEGEERDDRLTQDYDTRVIEFGGDVTRPLAGGALKFVGLLNRRKRDAIETYFFRSDGGEDLLGGFRQSDFSKRGETIGRLSWSRPKVLGFSFEAGGELAYNTLDSDVRLFEFDEDGSEVRIDLPIDQATVKELRGELFVNAGRQISKTFRVDLGLNYEVSRLKVRGDATADRSLRFLKPSLTLDWKPSGGWHGQVSIRRTVAQLDFYDFISLAELSSDRVNGGNANLQPQRAWEVRGVVEHPLLGDGQVRLEGGFDRISLLQDRILTEDGFDAPGNIGTGKRRFVSFTADAPLSRFGIKGGRLKFNGTLQRTRVEDPITGRPRKFSGFFPNYDWEVEYRQDIGKFAYGLEVGREGRITFFRTDELDSNFNNKVFGTAFVEYRPDARTTVTFDIDNLFSSHGQRERIFYTPNRTTPDPDEREFRDRNYHRVFGLTVRRSFGGANGGGGGAKS
ncbi:outer membrane beta-barrel protein [Sphingomonas arenae]|uniref:outer membrane beta-barrel protein n=1 Tax=Sphingomonas arenae TaxID=2812555 RepID=UPI001968050B|nr:outer membrane beta-barrel protein [Sphingomonas arenae]